MSAISFIVTTYNIAPYIETCLESVAAVARAGDEVIIIDDGSTDATEALIHAFGARGALAHGVTYKPVILGTNTIGGVGIGANIGLWEARCDTVFFVDGDDWIDAQGFNKARAQWALNTHDIMVANYRVFDEDNAQYLPPADNRNWFDIPTIRDHHAAQTAALTFIAVPWRKFYRRAFLVDHSITFPEGDFFFEDNPFHWDVCLAARDIGFANHVLCYHRTNRPGQTMASTGLELAAFFTHFETIQRKISGRDGQFELLAARWLLNNMTWHMDRLAPSARYSYALCATHSLGQIHPSIWQELERSEAPKPIWAVVNRLRDGDIWGQIDAWHRRDLQRDMHDLRDTLAPVIEMAQTQRNAHLAQSASDSFAILSQKYKGVI